MSRQNPQALMRQLQDVQDKMLEEQQALEHETVEISVGGGAVKVVMNGHQKVESVTIAPELLEAGEADMLTDLLVAGFNEAVERSQAVAQERMGAITNSLNLPPGMGL